MRSAKRTWEASSDHGRAARRQGALGVLWQGGSRPQGFAHRHRGHHRQRDRPQWRGQDDAAGGDHGHAGGQRRHTLPGRGDRLAVRGAARRRRTRARAREARPVRVDDRVGQPRTRRVRARPARRSRHRANARRRVCAFSAPAGAARAACGNAVRRRAANAGAGTRADEQAETPHAGRAVARTCAAGRTRDIQHRFRAEGRGRVDPARGTERARGAAGFRLRVCAGNRRTGARGSERRACVESEGRRDVSGAERRAMVRPGTRWIGPHRAQGRIVPQWRSFAPRHPHSGLPP